MRDAQSMRPEMCMCEEARGPRCRGLRPRKEVVGEAWSPSG